jgi:hypothetical protein
MSIFCSIMAIYKLGYISKTIIGTINRNIEYRYVDLTSVKTNNYKTIKKGVHPSRAKWLIKEPTILIGRVRPANKSHAFLVPKEELVASSGFTCIQNNENIIHLPYL